MVQHRSSVPIMRVEVSEEEVAAVLAVLRSGNLREGPVCAEFEKEFARRVGARYAISVSSGTAALHVAYAAILQPGDEVLVPAFTFFATASMVVAAGGRPVFCDVDPETLTIDTADARRRVTARTRAIAPVHLYGNPSNVAAVRKLAEDHNLKIVWDAAQAHGARYEGKDIGGLADAVCYSFYPSKNMTTGEGGMITTSDAAFDGKCRVLRNHGQTGKYYHTVVGFNYRLTDVMAALGLKQLEKLDGWIQRRRANARYLTERLAGVPGIRIPVEQPRGESSFNLYTILLDLSQFRCDRDEFLRLLNAEGIGAAVHYPQPLHQQPAFAGITGALRLPVSEDVSRRVVSLPVYPGLGQEDLEAIVAAVRHVAEAVCR